MGQGVGRVWRPPAPRDERARPTDPSSTSFDRSGPDKGSSTVQKRFSMMARAVEGAPDCAPHPATRHLISRMRLRARYTGAWQHVPVLQQRRCSQEREELQREREQQREAGQRRRGQEQQRGWSSACRRRRRHGLRGRRGGATSCTARVRDAGGFDTALRGVNLYPNARGPADHEHLGRSPAFSPQSPPLSHHLTRPVSRRFPLRRKSGAHRPRLALYFSPTSSPRARRSALTTCRL